MKDSFYTTQVKVTEAVATFHVIILSLSVCAFTMEPIVKLCNKHHSPNIKDSLFGIRIAKCSTIDKVQLSLLDKYKYKMKVLNDNYSIVVTSAKFVLSLARYISNPFTHFGK